MTDYGKAYADRFEDLGHEPELPESKLMGACDHEGGDVCNVIGEHQEAYEIAAISLVADVLARYYVRDVQIAAEIMAALKDDDGKVITAAMDEDEREIVRVSRSGRNIEKVGEGEWIIR